MRVVTCYTRQLASDDDATWRAIEDAVEAMAARSGMTVEQVRQMWDLGMIQQVPPNLLGNVPALRSDCDFGGSLGTWRAGLAVSMSINSPSSIVSITSIGV